MTPEEFAHQLGQIQGTLAQIVAQGVHQIDQNNRLDSKLDRVRTELSEKIDADVAKVDTRVSALGGKMDQVRTDLLKKIDDDVGEVHKRVDAVNTRVSANEVESAKAGVKAGILAGGLGAVAVGLAIRIGEALLKLKGGQ